MQVICIEKLAAANHDRWVHWTKRLAATEDIPPKLIDHWRKFWVSYEQLSEDAKEPERIWARKALQAMNN